VFTNPLLKTRSSLQLLLANISYDGASLLFINKITLQHRTKLSLEDDAMDLKGLAEVAAKENSTLALLHNTVQQLHARSAMYTATEEKQQQVTRLSAQLAWAELAEVSSSMYAHYCGMHINIDSSCSSVVACMIVGSRSTQACNDIMS
jgi:hypothetical protein